LKGNYKINKFKKTNDMIHKDDFNKIFDQFFNGSSKPYYYTQTYRLVPNDQQDEEITDVNFTKDGAYLHFEVPGFNKTNLEITIEGSELVLEGTRKYKVNGNDKEKKLSRRVDLGNLYEPSTIEATVEDGILTVYIPSYRKDKMKRKNRINIA